MEDITQDVVEGPAKRCTRCGVMKPADHFSPRLRAKDRLTSHCKTCRRRWVKRYRQTDQYAEWRDRYYRRDRTVKRYELWQIIRKERKDRQRAIEVLRRRGLPLPTESASPSLGRTASGR